LANHVKLDDATVANRGNHTVVQFPEQTVDPQTGITEFSIFAKDVATQTDQLFFVYPGNTPVVQFTNYQIYSVTPTAQQTTYFTFLPGGLLIYFGTFGPFVYGVNSTLFLNPPVAKNLVSANFCVKGTSPYYAPAFLYKIPTVEDIYNPPPKPEYVKSLEIVSSLDDSNRPKNVTVYYLVVANI
jgi:hypothetical protein